MATGDRGATATVQATASSLSNTAVASGTATTRLNDAISHVTADGFNSEAHSSATSADGITSSIAEAGDYPGYGKESSYAPSTADGSAASGLVTSEATANGGTAVAFIPSFAALAKSWVLLLQSQMCCF